jgi:hypothetical protein
MSYPINYPTPQNANVQIFSGNDYDPYGVSWVKPQGASFVWFTLIGGGGDGDGTTGGGSGNVTNFMCPAFLIPDVLRVSVSGGGGLYKTQVIYQAKDGTGYTLLQATDGQQGGGTRAANAANYFTTMGFYQSVSGQSGVNGSVNISATTFLSGGGSANSPQDSNYGYYTTDGTQTNANGFFQIQPIIVGAGGIGSGKGGIGCGGGSNGKGGPGMAVIITW